jgi:predicted transcriptional regulator of viral defense system
MTIERALVGLGDEKVDVRVARLAAQQWNVVDSADLEACGLSPTVIATRVAHGRLFGIHRGVYAVIPNLTVRGILLAAVRACGTGAVGNRSALRTHSPDGRARTRMERHRPDDRSGTRTPRV